MTMTAPMAEYGTTVPPRAPQENPDAFGRLVRIARDNERLFAEQRALAERLAWARDYGADPTGNAVVGAAHLRRLRIKQSGIQAQLRANRIEAHLLLRAPGRVAAVRQG